MVTFGGADIRNLAPSVLQTLVTHFPTIEKNIVIGNAFRNIDEIKKHADKNTRLVFNASSKTMINLMQTNDLAIASGGQTLYELARIGIPAIAILLVDNAKDDTDGWDKVGSIKNIGWWDSNNLSDDLVTAIKALKDKNTRQTMQNKAKHYINPNGAKLLVAKIIDKIQ